MYHHPVQIGPPYRVCKRSKQKPFERERERERMNDIYLALSAVFKYKIQRTGNKTIKCKNNKNTKKCKT